MSNTPDGATAAAAPAESSATVSSHEEAIAQGKERAKDILAASGIDLVKKDKDNPAEPNGRDYTPVVNRKRKRETPIDRIQASEYVDREYHYKALYADQLAHPVIAQQKKQELALYQSLRQRREHDPGSVFGYGYEGFGNPRTDDKTIRDPVLYPRQRRPGKRKTLPPRVPRKDQYIQAEQSEDLVPIRLDIDWQKIKLRDTFTWNLHDRTTSVDYFAEKIVEDFDLEVQNCRPLVQSIATSIRDQLHDYCPQIYADEEPWEPSLPYFAYKNDEMRILVKLNITIGQNTLIDQFEWDINSPFNSPEEFARQMTSDLSLAGEFTTAIAHSIREQCQLFSKSLHITGHPFDGRPIDDPDLRENFLQTPLPTTFRPYQAAKDYTPYLYELNEADLERTELSISREQRRQKRSTNRRGGPALPDLKDRQRTIRSLVVSSVIPGAALSTEESRIFRIAKATRKSARAQRDGFEDSDESDSDESGPDSPAIPAHLLQGGTARTRGIRNAALSATVGIRSNLSGFASVRSATPESIAPSHHEGRASARKKDYKEESDDESMPEKLVVVLKVGKAKLREWMRSQRAKDRAAHVSNLSNAGSPRPVTQSRSVSAAPLNLAGMPPPPSPAMAPTSIPAMAPTSVRATGPTSAPVMAPGDIPGAVDATANPKTPAPPPPEWLVQDLQRLRNIENYSKDRFEPLMKHMAIDPATGKLVTPSEATRTYSHKYVPRIRCSDCLGKVYLPGEGLTASNFESHLKNRVHRANVDARTTKKEPA
ncbi:SWI/SNF chromatin-remodeling complex subunit [Cladophialophora chaetospira]|uniref:SWI/SNF chromatin-remodeling complex subunit n=1 Tax=Cladophialophora chaetospira TaxID=386627 RepID=A0AA38XIM4_9EURO|nr:SWI/SNF chromatin-remodeling complex subunit [Cladophialophora chaetospira]